MALPSNMLGSFFKLVSVPKYGFLTRNGNKLVPGSKFSNTDIERGLIKYINERVPEEWESPSSEDSFTFVLWNSDIGTITSESYLPCYDNDNMPFPTPMDGIFTFTIRINPIAPPIVEISSSYFILSENSSIRFDNFYFNSDNPGYSPNEIVHRITSDLKYGYIRVRGNKTDTFTQADVLSKSVSYVSGSKSGVEHIELMSCNIASMCATSTFDITVVPEFKQIGDNVIYGQTGSVFIWDFKANRPHVIWELVNGTTRGPKNAPIPDDEIIESLSTIVSETPNQQVPNNTVLPEYRNLKESVLWDGGLPPGMMCSNMGYLETAERKPLSLAGSQPWVLPNRESEYFFTMKAIDAETGLVCYRRYQLVVNTDGTNIAGLLSESKSL